MPAGQNAADREEERKETEEYSLKEVWLASAGNAAGKKKRWGWDTEEGRLKGEGGVLYLLSEEGS